MDDFKKVCETYWRYYLELEKDYLNIGRFVELSESNYETYSIEFLKLLLAICGEIDAVATYVASTMSKERIDGKNEWWPIIKDKVKISQYLVNYYDETKRILISDFCCNNIRLRQKIYPWKELDISNKKSKEPSWWTCYNKVKHHRTEKDKELKFYYTKANLKNVSYALAALYTLELYLLESTGTINDLQRMDEYSTVFYQKSRLSYEDSFAILNEKTQQNSD